MTAVVEETLTSLGIKLPVPPAPAGSYVPVVVTGNLAFVAGQIPTEGGQVKFRGKVGRDLTIEAGRQAARLCTINALVKITGFVNCDPSFTDQPKVINCASDLLVQVFKDNGKHARAAVGASSLPLDSAVEIEFIVEI
jgi:enamine deaminase RidA (YjgF/YER057c/UK114 family)